MPETRAAEWLKSMEGIATALVTASGAFLAVYVGVEGKLTQAARLLGLQEGAAQTAAVVGSLVVVLPLLWLLVRSYQRFARASRLEQPDRFTLSTSTPESLIGRATDLDRLHDSVRKNRVVLLDGESGCGKSALVVAGLIPRLTASSTGLLPVLIRDWGDDWVRGPLATALGTLFDVLTQEQRTALGWNSFPDLAADATALSTELARRLDSLATQLGRRPLLIADQFDDYQARHRDRFIDANGNWLQPDALATANPFWAVALAQLQTGALHLLAVTRADTASGLSCVRFVDKAMTADRHLPRVDIEYLRPLLERIAPADAEPPVISRPDHGWLELRDRLETDLRLQGAVLMQQVRTVLLGLRQLPMLSVAAYRRAGGLRGTESLVIARAVQRASDAIGGGEIRQALVRRVLGALVQPGGTNQQAKARRASFEDLRVLVGEALTTRTMLQYLQVEKVVRPADVVAGNAAWQLDHDYLAHAVLAEARQADRWGVALRDGREKFRHAGDGWRARWAALLSSGLQGRLAWERVRGRLRYGEAAGYARLSLMKPLLMVIVLGAASAGLYAWNEDRLLTLKVARINDRFGGRAAESGVLEAWRAPRAVRNRLYKLLHEDDGRWERAMWTAWPIAHGGLENATLQQAARDLRERLSRETWSTSAHSSAQAYVKVAAKLRDPSAIQQEVAALRERLARETNRDLWSSFAAAYTAVAAKLSDPSTIQQEASALRERLTRETNRDLAPRFAASYAAVAAKLSDPSALQQEFAALRECLARETDHDLASSFAVAYAALAAKLSDPSAVQQAALTLRERLVRETNNELAPRFAAAYAAVAAKLSNPLVVQLEAAALRERLARETDDRLVSSFAQAYVVVAAKLVDPSAIQQETAALREHLVVAKYALAQSFAEAYVAVAANLTDPFAIQQEASALRERLSRQTSRYRAPSFAAAYAAVAAKLTDPSAIQQAAAALRESLERETRGWASSSLAAAYVAVATKLTDPTAIQQEATALRERLARQTDRDLASSFAAAYAVVAAKLSNPSAIQQEATALRERLAIETDGDLGSSFSQAYVAIAAKLTDSSAIQQEVAALRERLAIEKHGDLASSFSQAYVAIAAKLTDASAIQQEVAALRERVRETKYDPAPLKSSLARVQYPLASSFAAAYAAVVAKLADPSVIRQEAAALRERLTHEGQPIAASGIAAGYATVAAKLTDPSAIQQEAAALRERLAETKYDLASSFAEAYAAVAANLTDPLAMQQEATALRERLARETDYRLASIFAQAYATVAKRLVEDSLRRGDGPAAAEEVRRVLIMTGHPYLDDASSLLAALRLAAGRDFEKDVGAAVAWWSTAYGGDPATLRPSPVAP